MFLSKQSKTQKTEKVRKKATFKGLKMEADLEDAWCTTQFQPL